MPNSIKNNKKMTCPSFHTDKSGYVQVYVDGSCYYNGKPEAYSGLGVYFGENNPLNLSAPGRYNPTNQSAALQGSIEAIRLAKDYGFVRLQINTNNDYVVNSMTRWMTRWMARGWLKSDLHPPKNLIDIFELFFLTTTGSIKVRWNLVARKNGNRRADRLAKKGADMYKRGLRYDTTQYDRYYKGSEYWFYAVDVTLMLCSRRNSYCSSNFFATTSC